MVASDVAPEALEFSVIDLSPFLSSLSLVVIEKGEDSNGLCVLTMRDFCIELWVAAADGAGGRTWKMLEKSVRFYRALESMLVQRKLRRDELEIIGVVDGVVFLRQSGCLMISIDPKTMKLSRLSEEDCSPALICLYMRTRTWPPAFLNPTE